MAGRTIEPATEMRGVRLKYEGLEVPGLYVRHKDASIFKPHVLIFRNILSDAEAEVFKQESAWDYVMMAADEIEKDCIFPVNDVAIYAFRTFLWQCPDGVSVTVSEAAFRHVLEHFKLSIFKRFDLEHVQSHTPIYGIDPVPVGLNLLIDNRYIHVGKPIAWRGQFPTVDSPATPILARYDGGDYTVLLHEDWTVERLENKKGG